MQCVTVSDLPSPLRSLVRPAITSLEVKCTSRAVDVGQGVAIALHRCFDIGE